MYMLSSRQTDRELTRVKAILFGSMFIILYFITREELIGLSILICPRESKTGSTLALYLRSSYLCLTPLSHRLSCE